MSLSNEEVGRLPAAAQLAYRRAEAAEKKAKKVEAEAAGGGGGKAMALAERKAESDARMAALKEKLSKNKEYQAGVSERVSMARAEPEREKKKQEMIERLKGAREKAVKFGQELEEKEQRANEDMLTRVRMAAHQRHLEQQRAAVAEESKKNRLAKYYRESEEIEKEKEKQENREKEAVEAEKQVAQPLLDRQLRDRAEEEDEGVEIIELYEEEKGRLPPIKKTIVIPIIWAERGNRAKLQPVLKALGTTYSEFEKAFKGGYAGVRVHYNNRRVGIEQVDY
jgi:hypothetical protein